MNPCRRTPKIRAAISRLRFASGAYAGGLRYATSTRRWLVRVPGAGWRPDNTVLWRTRQAVLQDGPSPARNL